MPYYIVFDALDVFIIDWIEDAILEGYASVTLLVVLMLFFLKESDGLVC